MDSASNKCKTGVEITKFKYRNIGQNYFNQTTAISLIVYKLKYTEGSPIKYVNGVKFLNNGEITR